MFPTFAPVQAWLLFAQGRLEQGADVLDAAVEAARLAGSPHSLVWVLFTRVINAIYRGEVEAALADGEEAVAVSALLDSEGIVTTWTYVTYAAALAEAGEPGRALELASAHAGGPPLPRVPGMWRAFYLDRFVPAWLAVGKTAEADAAARHRRDDRRGNGHTVRHDGGAARPRARGAGRRRRIRRRGRRARGGGDRRRGRRARSRRRCRGPWPGRRWRRPATASAQ